MTTRTLDCPVFDADHHMYETRDALTMRLTRFNGRVGYAASGEASAC